MVYIPYFDPSASPSAVNGSERRETVGTILYKGSTLFVIFVVQEFRVNVSASKLNQRVICRFSVCSTFLPIGRQESPLCEVVLVGG